MTRLLLRQILFMTSTFIGITLITYSLSLVDVKQTTTTIGTTQFLQSQTTSANNADTAVQMSYFTYLDNILHGDLGVSSISKKQVTDEFLSHLPTSIELVFLATTLAIVIGLPLGVIAAIYHKRPTDMIINNIALGAYSMPIFWWGLILLMYFSIHLGVTPVAGRLNFLFDIEPVTGFILIDTYLSDEIYRLDAFKDAISHLILPVIVLATLPTAIIARLIRQNMIETLAKDYILTARAKGLSLFKIYWVHGLRNALPASLNMLSLQISTLMTGAMLTEYLFLWPGIGKWIIDALLNNDYQSLQGGILITTIMVIFINAVIELLHLWLSPKMRYQSRVSNFRIQNGQS